MRQIVFTAPSTATVVERPDLSGPLPPREVRGKTLVSLVSPGTELNWGYLGNAFPVYPGYACVFEVEEAGSEIVDLSPGTVVFGSGPHAERQQAPRESLTPLPAGLLPEEGVFARLMGVSMSTLTTTAARPPARVLVTGLGPVGNLAAQVFERCGYIVTGVDPAPARRKAAQDCGIRDVRPGVAGEPDLLNQMGLHLECSGSEQAVLEGCRCVCKRGEVVLIGVPWRRRVDLQAFDLLHAVFHRYVVLRSGWEWEVPRQPRDFALNSIAGNYAAALAWLAEGKIRTGGLAVTRPPSHAPEVYRGLLDQSLPAPGALFDWRLA